ncbi:MAG: septum formation initiator family protein [Gordonia sp. (in: high G+C Gram-positive bacteria)]|uniref:FtsB family cell division protein n=1 Tax=Gordonia sp. (in: high G+C Gram-positive bacteria) TaxID=84139 RepID=UPI0039E6FABF
MVKNESGRGGRGRATGRPRTPGTSRPAPRRPRARSAADAAEPVASSLDTCDDAAPDSTMRLPSAASFRMPAVFERIASVNARRAIGLLAVLVLLALTLAVPTRTYLAQRAEFNRLEAENAQLAQEVDELQKRVTEQNDPAWIEQEARSRLQFRMPGEKVVVLQFPAKERRQAEEKAAREYAANPWYSNLWDAVSTPPEK